MIKKYPEQWEGWVYLHTFANITDFKDYDKPKVITYVLNKKIFGCYNINSEKYLFNKHTYSSYPIDNATYKVLLKSISTPIYKDELDENIFSQLYNHQVFIESE